MMGYWYWRNIQVTLEPNVDRDAQAPTSVGLTCVQGNEPFEEQQGEEMVSQESIMLECAHDVKVEFVDCASDQPSIVLEDLHLGEVEEVETTMLLMVLDEIMLIPHMIL